MSFIINHQHGSAEVPFIGKTGFPLSLNSVILRLKTLENATF